MTFRSLFTRRTMAVVVGWTLLAAFAGESLARFRQRDLLESARDDAQAQAQQVASTVNELLTVGRGIAISLQQYPASRDLLETMRSVPIASIADSPARRAALTARPDVMALARTFRSTIVAVPIFNAAWIQDRDGLMLASSDFDAASSRLGQFYPHRELVLRLHGEDEVWYFAPSAITKRPGFVFGVPVVNGPRVTGAVVLRTEADSLSRLLVGLPGDVTMIADSTGRVLASSDTRLVLHRLDVDGAWPDSLTQRLPTVASLLGPAFERTAEARGLNRVWAIAPVRALNLMLHVVREVPLVASQANDARLLALVVWLAGILALFARARARQQLVVTQDAEHRALAEGQRVRDLLNTSYDAVVTLDIEHRVVDWNARAESMFGYTAAEMVGTDPTDRIMPPHWRDRHADGFRVAAHIGRSEVFGKPRELSALNFKGDEFPVELTMSPARDANGGTLFVAFFRDIAARKREEQARADVAARVDRYRSVVMDLAERDRDEWAAGLRDVLREAKRALEVERASFWRLDEHVERMTCECMLAADAEDAESAGLMLTRDQSPGYFRALRRRQPIVASDAVHHDATKEFAESYLLPNGVGSVLDTPVWFEGREVGVLSFHHLGAPRTWEAETVEFATTIASHIGALMESVRRVESERALNAERERMELVLSRSPIAQTVWDMATGLVFANPATLALFKYPAESAMIGKLPWELAPSTQPDGRTSVDGAQAEIGRLFEMDQHTFEWTHQKADGSTFPASITLVNLSDKGVQRFIATIIDLSEQKAAQAAIIAAKEAAESAEAAKSAFLATMSHEIRTPMNGVMSMAEMLDQTDLDDDQRSMLQVVRSSADSLLTIINDILDVSKIEAGKMTLEEVDVSPAAIIEDVVTLLSPRAQDKNVGLYAEVAANVPAMVLGDPTRLRQIVVNLAGNALKFTEKGFVRVRATVNTVGHLRIEVTDTGIGLTAEQRSRLFQPFMQADSSTSRKFGGTGLGLSICRKLVEIMGGQIGVDSQHGSGSTFWFEVPLGASAPPATPEVAINDLQVMLAGFPEEQARILDGYVRAAGAAAAIIYARTSDAVSRLKSDASIAPVVVFPTYPDDYPGGALQIARALRELPGREQTPVCLIVPSTLISSASAAAQTGFIATTGEPVRRDRFWKMLAVAVGRAEAERRAKRSSGVEHYEAPALEVAAAKGAVILVAEDNRTNQIVISRLLSQLGLAHEMADNGAEALKRLDADRARFGVLLTDFHMPEMDGFELTAHWRERERTGAAGGHLPILALTADALAGMAERCKEAGMDGYLTKPIVRDALIEELERWLPVAFALRTEAAATARGRKSVTAPTVETVVGAPPPSAAATPPALDYAEFARQLGIEPGPDALELLGTLWESVAALGDELRHALAARDRVALREVAHGGKGAARSIAAMTLGDLCSALQDEAEALPWEALADKVEAVVQEHDRVGRQVEAMAGR